MKEIRRIELANGPGMTVFGPDGRYGFVCSSFNPELAVVSMIVTKDSPMFDAIGGLHHIYVNSVGFSRLKEGRLHALSRRHDFY